MSLPWPWHFISLSSAEIQHRRELLDLRGYYAQLSVVLALVAVRCYNGCISSANYPTSSRGRRSWWDSPPFRNWKETRTQYITCLIWLGWLLGLSIWRSGDDYLHLTKALGHVALSQLPFQVLMSPVWYISASRPASPSVISVLTSIPQPALTSFHRLFGRVVISSLLLAHAALYLSFFIQSTHPNFSSLLAKRVRDSDVQCGLFGIIIMIIIVLFTRPTGSTSWPWVSRAKSVRMRRQVFYVVHVLLVATLGLAAYSHVAQARVFVLETLGAFVINAVCCWMLS